MNNLDDYAMKLGKFWINFNSLELLLRLYLTKKNSESEIGLELNIGDVCGLSHLTNYDSFKELAAKYNASVSNQYKIDISEINRLRDAIAHGRVVSKTDLPMLPMTVVKFSKPSKDTKMVTVEIKETLTAAYLDKCIKDMYNISLLISGLLDSEFK